MLLASLDPHPNLTPGVVLGLGWVYLALFLMNAWWTWRTAQRDSHVRMPGSLGGQDVPLSGFWAIYTGMLLMIALAHFAGYRNPEGPIRFISMPDAVKQTIDLFAGPVLYFTVSIVGFTLMIVGRKWLVRPHVGWLLLNVAMLFTALSITDWNFRQIVGKPDNVPIVAMLFIVGYFTWLYFARAVENDERTAQGRPLIEQEDNEKVLVWPDLVYTELICMVALTALLVVWGVGLEAPLEEPATSAKTPNPSKAPWYFLGLQEMLVYYDPWLAGVVFPSLILVGLMAIPYIDFNPKGNGYYTFNERPFAVATFMFGFLPLWIAMIILGTFLRGPNWNFFGFYEYWDVHKLEMLENVNLSEYVWLSGYMPQTWRGLPTPMPEQSFAAQLGTIALRELPGLLLVAAYLLVLPPLMAATVFKSFFLRMGFIRYMVFAMLLLSMAALPIKMVLRWAFNLKYIVAVPEWFFNI